MFNRKTGVARIDTIIDKFNVVRGELELGIQEVEAEMAVNKAALDKLVETQTILDTTKADAAKLIKKIDKLFD